jgi:alpha-glucoside transport system permease protein
LPRSSRLPPPRPTRSDAALKKARASSLLFVLPALILLAALVAWPIVFTIVRSLYNRNGDAFVGLGNYAQMFSSSSTLIALRNNVIWVLVAPTLVTSVGLVFAVMTERVSWASAFKIVVFMPMAVSFLAAGVTFRLVYEQDPNRGVANALITAVHDAFSPPGPYPGARVRDGDPSDALFPLVGISASSLPRSAKQAADPTSVPDGGVVWLDFAPGGGGRPGVVDPGEKGTPGARVDIVRDGKVVAHVTTRDDGSYRLPRLQAGVYQFRLPAWNFKPPFGGVAWLGPALVTPSLIIAYLWIWAGFAMVVIAAGLAAIPREVLEAARVDGANELQVFRRVTVPLLGPVLAVVMVTLIINVLKVFDLVLVVPPGSVQADANVIALEMWRVSFGGARDQGLGSALGVFLFVLVLPAMLFNIRRFRRESVA